MPKIKTVQIDDTVYTVREKIPYRIMDMFVNKMETIEDTVDPAEKNKGTFEVKTWLLKEMIISPAITDEFLKNEADIELWNYGFDLMMETAGLVEKRFEELKKKHPKLFASRTETNG